MSKSEVLAPHVLHLQRPDVHRVPTAGVSADYVHSLLSERRKVSVGNVSAFLTPKTPNGGVPWCGLRTDEEGVGHAPSVTVLMAVSFLERDVSNVHFSEWSRSSHYPACKTLVWRHMYKRRFCLRLVPDIGSICTRGRNYFAS